LAKEAGHTSLAARLALAFLCANDAHFEF
jgi:hypothetical protein